MASVRLTVKDDPESIKRYAHVKPARGWGVKACGARCPGTLHTCTLAGRHRGPHVSHGLFQRTLAVWDDGTEARIGRETLQRSAEARAGSGLRTRAALGTVEAWMARAARLFASVEEVAMIVMFLAFVGFAVHWVLLILGR